MTVILENTQRSVLNLEIEINYRKAKKNQQSIDSLINTLLDEHIWGNIRQFIVNKFGFSIQKIKKINKQKITRRQNI